MLNAKKLLSFLCHTKISVKRQSVIPTWGILSTAREDNPQIPPIAADRFFFTATYQNAAL
jgi:hypothetical protein